VVVPQALLRLLVAQKRWADVVAECDAGQRRARRFFFYFFLKAEALAELGRDDDALAAVDRVTKDASFPARRQKARVLGILGRYQDMAAVCEATLKEFTAPDEIQAMRYVLAEAYLGLRQFDKAEAELRKVLEDDPDDVLALNNLGYNLADQGRKLAEAEEMVRRAVELDRDERARAGIAQAESAAYLDSLGWVLFRKGNLAEAREYLAKAADLSDGAADPTVWDHLGDVCFRLGEKAKAKEAWGKAAGLYENSHQGRQLGRLDEVRRKLKLAEAR
jgi:tetratricopeptide (TPR) repeat protein